MYTAWVTERGWRVTYSNRQKTWHNAIEKYIPIVDVNIDSNEDGNEPAQKEICTYRAFRAYWKSHFGVMKIRNRGEDVCTDCVMFTNKIQALKKKARKHITDTSIEQSPIRNNPATYQAMV